MKKFIAQKDEICGQCGVELPRGEFIMINYFDEVLCCDCYDNEYIGETYG